RAKQEWQEAARLNPNNADAWELLAEAYLSEKNWKAAVEPFRQLLRLRPDTANVYERLAAAALHSGEEASAAQFAQEELQRDPKNIEALKIAIRLLPYAKDAEQKLNYLRQMVALQPNDSEFSLLLAQEAITQHRYPEALAALDSLLQREPENVKALSLRGMSRVESAASAAEQAQAEADLKRALELAPGVPFPRFYLGKLYARQGRMMQAVAQLELAARAMPGRKEIFFELQNAYAQTGQPARAAQARQQFAALQQEETLLDTLQKRCVVEPNDFDSHLRLGLLLLKHGDRRKAGLFLKRAQTLRPEDIRVKTALQQVALQSGRPESLTVPGGP
ncbi:MAG TPA: tetratricopeptide repeat protein, partial [Chthonomonadaceae bacterium]|nr:tetratricopeptide repeat protein [Chthonomonadaceae bacterium]